MNSSFPSGSRSQNGDWDNSSHAHRRSPQVRGVLQRVFEALSLAQIVEAEPVFDDLVREIDLVSVGVFDDAIALIIAVGNQPRSGLRSLLRQMNELLQLSSGHISWISARQCESLRYGAF